MDRGKCHCHLGLLWFFKAQMLCQRKRVKGCANSGITLLMPKHYFTLQNVLIKFAKFLAN